jgi:hypothetical protein
MERRKSPLMIGLPDVAFSAMILLTEKGEN